MKRTHALLWSLVGLTALITVLYSLFLYLSWNTPVPESWSVDAGLRHGIFDILNDVVFSLIITILPVFLGVLVVYQKPGNPIGWLLVDLGIANMLVQFIREVTIYANFTLSPPLITSPVINLVQNQVWIWVFFILFWLLSIFPDGELPPKRWRFIIVGILILTFGIILSSTIENPMQSAFFLPNPLQLPAYSQALYSVVRFASLVLGFVSVVIGLSAYYITRFLQAKGVQRQQYKWLGLSVFLMAVFVLVGLILGVVMGLIGGQLLLRYSLMLVTVGIGIAVLRFRLYDIDVIIRRTLVYTAITLLLILVYFATVLVLQFLFTALTGQQSPVAIVVSTLFIAALFNPLRIRVQDFIDRRFYRRKYDAEKALAAFAETARDEVDMGRLVDALLNVMGETMQPEEASLWLKTEKQTGGFTRRKELG